MMACAAGLAVPLAGHPASPAVRPEAGQEIAVTGEVVETGCFVMAGRRGAQHRQCAISCARAGQPLGVLDDQTGTLYLAVLDRTAHVPQDPLAPLIAQRVELRGTLAERGGVSAILVKRVRPLDVAREAK